MTSNENPNKKPAAPRKKEGAAKRPESGREDSKRASSETASDPVVNRALNHDFGYPVGTYGYGPNGRSDHSEVDQDTASASQRGGYDDRKKSQGESADDDPVAEGSEESFPASDPPSWTTGKR